MPTCYVYIQGTDFKIKILYMCV